MKCSQAAQVQDPPKRSDVWVVEERNSASTNNWDLSVQLITRKKCQYKGELVVILLLKHEIFCSTGALSQTSLKHLKLGPF